MIPSDSVLIVEENCSGHEKEKEEKKDSRPRGRRFLQPDESKQASKQASKPRSVGRVVKLIY
jgi:hypothetical protein